jgi:hypothetical protein
LLQSELGESDNKSGTDVDGETAEVETIDEQIHRVFIKEQAREKELLLYGSLAEKVRRAIISSLFCIRERDCSQCSDPFPT